METRTSDMSLRQLAKGLGVSQPFLSQIRTGKRPLPDSLRARVEALGAYHLLMGDKQMETALLRANPDTKHGAPGGIRTHNLLLRRQLLCPLSYWGEQL